MSQCISLLFGVHAHQPVGNFPAVISDAHLRCYKPFLHTLYRYPDFRFSVHFSGWLLDYLIENFPEDIELLRKMVERNQVELFGAGDTEPVLAVIPNRDRIGQIKSFSDRLFSKLGQRPQGAWLTERVWESTVVPALASCDIRYVIVDDYHFLCAGKSDVELNGYFTTEEDAHTLDLFPISEKLRYKLPFSTVDDAIANLEYLADSGSTSNRNAAIYFDDIEKFGIWPETYEWVYEKGWLEQFIQKVLASPKICTQHYRDYHAAEKTRGMIYLPTVSYIEMNEWTLPADAASQYTGLVQQAKSTDWYEQRKAFIRGGIWKNFFTRYPESNWMHKRMLGLSVRLAHLPEAQQNKEMLKKLYEAQANDAYWHGLFGGLYLPHLRRAIYNSLIELERLLDACHSRPAYSVTDMDLDGIEEAFLQNGILQAVIKLDQTASIYEFDAYLLKHNFGDTLRRRQEHYYQKIQMNEHSVEPSGDVEGIVSAHDRVNFKHEINIADIEPDDQARSMFIDGLDDVVACYRHLPPNSDFDGIGFQADIASLLITKRYTLLENSLRVKYNFTGEIAQHVFTTQINLAMPSCDGMGGRYIYQGEIIGGFGQLLKLENLTDIMLDDVTLAGSVILKTSSAVTLSARPHFIVSQSEDGFEKIMQAVELILSLPIIDRELVITLEINTKKS